MRLCWMPALLLISVTLLAQPLPVQPCPADALDASFQAIDGPDHSGRGAAANSGHRVVHRASLPLPLPIPKSATDVGRRVESAVVPVAPDRTPHLAH